MYNIILYNLGDINYTNNNINVFSIQENTSFFELFNNKKILELTGPIIITKNKEILEYDFSKIFEQLSNNKITKLFTMPDPINSSLEDKLIDLIYTDKITNDDAINIYKILIKYSYNLNFKGIFLDNFIGFSDAVIYKNFSKYIYTYKDIENFSILYTYIINSFYKFQEVIPLSIKIINKDYYFNNAIFYNDIEKLIY